MRIFHFFMVFLAFVGCSNAALSKNDTCTVKIVNASAKQYVVELLGPNVNNQKTLGLNDTVSFSNVKCNSKSTNCDPYSGSINVLLFHLNEMNREGCYQYCLTNTKPTSPIELQVESDGNTSSFGWVSCPPP